MKNSPASQRQINILAMAKWVENYRQSLTPEQRAALSAQVQTEAGHAMLRAATAQYNSQDVQYRAMTAPVISQLLITIGQMPKP